MAVRVNTYVITFMTYATVHMMRMNYSFNKHNIQHSYGVSSLFLGCLDALIFLSLSLGTFFRYSIIKNQEYTLMCLKTAIPTALSFAVVPIVSLMRNGQGSDNSSSHGGWGIHLLLFTAFACFGFFQFAFFPVLLTIFSHHFNVKKQGSLVGFWSSKSNAGNIIGFFISNFMVFQLNKNWQSTMIICSISHLVLGILCYALLQNPVQRDKDPHQQQHITTPQFFTFIKEKWAVLQFKLYILSFSFFKAILYSYQLWTPIFLTHQGYPQYAGYVPILFDIFTLLGSFLMGKLYQQISQDSDQSLYSVFLRKYKFFLCSIFIIMSSIMYMILPPNIIVYFILGAFMGLFLGAVYNALENNEILHYSKNNLRQTDLMSTVNIAVGSTLVGLFQIIIGVVLNHGHGQSSESGHGSGRIYVIITFMAIIAAILSFMRARIHNENVGLGNHQSQISSVRNPLTSRMIEMQRIQ